ncbi:hypothetical protein [Trichothermofontia sp.]
MTQPLVKAAIAANRDRSATRDLFRFYRCPPANEDGIPVRCPDPNPL